MLFESESKASNFIKFNKDEIVKETGKAPVRSYYCQFCGGWHITSNPNEEIGARLNERDTQKINEVTELKNKVKEISQKTRIERDKLIAEYNTAKENLLIYMNLGKFDEAQECYTKATELLRNDRILWHNLNKNKIYIQHLGDILTVLEYEETHKGDVPQKLVEIVNTHEYSQLKENCVLSKTIESEIQSLKLSIEEVDEPVLKEKIRQIETSLTKFSGTKIEKNRFAKGYRLELKTISDAISKKKEIIKTSLQRESQKTDSIEFAKTQNKTYRRPISTSIAKDIVKKLESVIIDFNEGNVSRCEDTLEVCDIILDEVDRDDDMVIQKLRGIIETWRTRLTMSNIG